jgi:hypothetical protein
MSVSSYLNNVQERVEIVKAENGYTIHVYHATKNNTGVESMSMFTDIMGSMTEEGADPIAAIKKMASKKEMLDKTKRKQEEIYVAKNSDELMNILREVFTSMEG